MLWAVHHSTASTRRALLDGLCGEKFAVEMSRDGSVPPNALPVPPLNKADALVCRRNTPKPSALGRLEGSCRRAGMQVLEAVGEGSPGRLCPSQEHLSKGTADRALRPLIGRTSHIPLLCSSSRMSLPLLDVGDQGRKSAT